ncbi:MAG TPA: hypothetical protein VH436_35960 [Vicinamibacterales bacterium]|jgi:hypothetical protein
MEFFLWLALLPTIVAPHIQAARFDVEGDTTTPATILATVEPNTGAPGYRLLRIYFYSSELTPSQRAMAASGRDEETLRSWAAIVQLTVDDEASVSKIDLAVPGHMCTVVQTDSDAAKALQEFEFNGRYLKLKSKAYSVCDLKLLGIPNPTFEWDLDLATPVTARKSRFE